MRTSEQQVDALKNEAVLFPLPQRTMLRISGADHIRYLHARLTQDIKGLSEGRHKRSLVLTPNGKIQGHFSVLRRPEDVLILTDPMITPEDQDELQRAILQFKVADRVEVHAETHAIFYFGGVAAEETLSSLSADPLPGPGEFKEYGVKDQRWIIARDTQLGFFIAAQREPDREPQNFFSSSVLGDAAGYDALRITRKIPEWGSDLSEKVSAGEIDTADVVSFNKGCYTGQEVVEMTVARGKPNKVLQQYMVPLSAMVDQDTEISDSEGKSVGSITSVATFPNRGIKVVLGFVKSGVINADDLSASDAILSAFEPL